MKKLFEINTTDILSTSDDDSKLKGVKTDLSYFIDLDSDTVMKTRMQRLLMLHFDRHHKKMNINNAKNPIRQKIGL